MNFMKTKDKILRYILSSMMLCGIAFAFADDTSTGSNLSVENTIDSQKYFSGQELSQSGTDNLNTLS